MMLSDATIKEHSEKYGLISPFNESKLQPSSYDLGLSDTFYTDKHNSTIRMDEIMIKPNDFILGSTVEKVHIPTRLVGRVEGKSSLGRIGLLTHVTAGFIDAGFNGNITLELKNIGNKPIVLNKGCNIAQICFLELDKECKNPYNETANHYQFQKDVTRSRYRCEDGVYYVR